MISEKTHKKHWIIKSINNIQNWKKKAQRKNRTTTLALLCILLSFPLWELRIALPTTLAWWILGSFLWNQRNTIKYQSFEFLEILWWKCLSLIMILSYLNYHRGHMPNPPQVPFTVYSTASQDALGAVPWPKAGKRRFPPAGKPWAVTCGCLEQWC